MNAHIAPPDPSTRKTSAIDTATAVSSGTTQRIDDFIKRMLGEAVSVDGSGIIDSSNRAAQLGFGNAANVRYSRFLEAFRSSPQLTEMYREKYPNSLFLPWSALHAVIKALNLWVDLPEFYAGAVPEEQLPWMEIFDMDSADHLLPIDAPGLTGEAVDTRFCGLLAGAAVYHRRGYMDAEQMPFLTYESRAGSLFVGTDTTDALQKNRRLRDALVDAWRQAESSFFVVAPAEAFTTQEDWLSRTRSMVKALYVEKVVPDDPLVIRFCHGGALVVAAWGDEAAALNEITKELKL